MAGFHPRANMKGTGSVAPVQHRLLEASSTYTLGDAVTNDTTNGYVDVAGAGVRVLGVLTALCDRETMPLSSRASVAHAGTLTGNPGQIGSETIATGATNVSADLVYGEIVEDQDILFFNDANGILTAAMVGKYFDTVAAGDQIDIATVGTSGQFRLMKVDPDGIGDVSNGLFAIAESQTNI